MYDHMSDYEPREMLFEALGMVKTLREIEGNEARQDILDDISHHIRWTLSNATIYKKMEVKTNE